MPPAGETLKHSLSDGAKLAYEILGREHLGKDKRPLVLVGGMTNIKIDWDRLVPSLTTKRPVLIYDHRGMGQSTYSTAAMDDDITIELMARDLLSLITHLGWKDVDIIGWSMGGVILQQILLFPLHTTQSTVPPFHVRHALLSSTLCSPIRQSFQPPPLSFNPIPGQPLTVEQRKEIARPMITASLGPEWVSIPGNKERFDLWLERLIHGRPARTIRKQQKTLSSFNFVDQLRNIPSSTKILVIHGYRDVIVPFSHAEEILQSCPHARMVQKGTRRGQVPSYEFGHIWYEYYGLDVWIGVIEAFIDDENDISVVSRL